MLKPARHTDNEPLGEERLRRAQAIGRQVIAAVEGREAYIRAHGLDADFCHPGNNWVDDPKINDYGAAYRLLRSLDPEQMTLLRRHAC